MLITFLVTTILVALTVLIHFEALGWLSAFMLSPHSRFRLALLVCMLGAMVAHVIEIWVFGLGYYYLTVLRVNSVPWKVALPIPWLIVDTTPL